MLQGGSEVFVGKRCERGGGAFLCNVVAVLCPGFHGVRLDGCNGSRSCIIFNIVWF